jgi:Domain of unknown function (DUF222)
MFVSDAAGTTRSAEPAAADVAGLTAALGAAVDRLAEIDAAAVGDDELAAAMVGLRREQARLAAVTAELTARYDARRVYAADGSLSSADWIATRARLPRRQIAGEVRVARRLAVMPQVAAAWRAGHIRDAHARLLGGLAAGVRTAVHFPAAEELLVDYARTLRFDDFERAVAHWRDVVDPDGPEQRRGRNDQLRRLNLAIGLDGVGHLDGYLTALGATTFGDALDRIERALFQADWAQAKTEHGDQTTTAHLSRTPAQRRHDALVEMAVRAMTAPADGQRPRPLVTVMVDYPTLTGRVCQLATGTVIAPGTVAELLGDDGTLMERAVFDGPNRIIDISSARSFRGILRRILEIKRPRCRHDTCHVPAARCQGDHVTAWSHGGLTTHDNGDLGCGPHNRWWYHHPDQRPAHHRIELRARAQPPHPRGWDLAYGDYRINFTPGPRQPVVA